MTRIDPETNMIAMDVGEGVTLLANMLLDSGITERDGGDGPLVAAGIAIGLMAMSTADPPRTIADMVENVKSVVVQATDALERKEIARSN